MFSFYTAKQNICYSCLTFNLNLWPWCLTLIDHFSQIIYLVNLGGYAITNGSFLELYFTFSWRAVCGYQPYRIQLGGCPSAPLNKAGLIVKCWGGGCRFCDGRVNNSAQVSTLLPTRSFREACHQRGEPSPKSWLQRECLAAALQQPHCECFL